jgi:uncharacterized protein (DUF1800 family)
MNTSIRRTSTLRRAVLGALLGAVCAAQLQASPQGTTAQTIGHYLRRTAFGVRKGQVAQLTPGYPGSILAYLTSQLAGNLPETPEFNSGRAAFGIPESNSVLYVPNASYTIENLQADNLFRAVYTQNQLRELMTMFWMQHFSTDYNKLVGYLASPANAGLLPPGGTPAQVATYLKFAETSDFRRFALGSFRDLLFASAKSPAMLIYLDSVANSVPPGSNLRPNENYMRELLELHTVGVSPIHGAAYRYYESDVTDQALVFSGWGINRQTTGNQTQWLFAFDQTKHTDAVATPNKFLTLCTLSNAMPPPLGPFSYAGKTGLQQGDHLLAYLSTAIETRLFVCSQLIEFFLGYAPLDPY